MALITVAGSITLAITVNVVNGTAGDLRIQRDSVKPVSTQISSETGLSLHLGQGELFFVEVGQEACIGQFCESRAEEHRPVG